MTSIRGPAGSGKTTMMQEAVRAVAALSGKDVFVVAPSSSGVEILKQQLEKVNLTESQRRDAINYNRGQVIEFHRKARSDFKSGERWEVCRCSSECVVVVKDGQAKLLPLAQPKSFNVYTQGGSRAGCWRHIENHEELSRRH